MTSAAKANRNAEIVDRLEAENTRLRELAQEAILQVEYLHEKFQPTGTGESFLVRAKAILALDIHKSPAE